MTAWVIAVVLGVLLVIAVGLLLYVLSSLPNPMGR